MSQTIKESLFNKKPLLPYAHIKRNFLLGTFVRFKINSKIKYIDVTLKYMFLFLILYLTIYMKTCQEAYQKRSVHIHQSYVCRQWFITNPWDATPTTTYDVYTSVFIKSDPTPVSLDRMELRKKLKNIFHVIRWG